jgi:hypothetical protein
MAKGIQRYQQRIKNFGHTALRAVRHTASFIDKGVGVAHQFLSHLSPQARMAIGNAIGPEHVHHANRLAQGVGRYEAIRERVAGARM